MTMFTPTLPPPIFTQVYIAYDTTTGQIHHTHHVTTFQGGHVPSVQESSEKVLRLISSAHPTLDLRQVKVMSVDPKQIASGVAYTVEPATLRLIAQPVTNPTLKLPTLQLGKE